ncbi:hypothetical protein N0V93_008039 [Gnomoniopsis smithogilvyi]|uniref:Fe2OG dioxygenase domain-containing protein n=1 Tax=Gnomoniopsis smithogilvyi TaxID=1191159 RepID=A0A9W8YPJ9_9PEZI|nr:hypothetical protein N0V93_008039 [Gnomoniopsis smithogilvyi]
MSNNDWKATPPVKKPIAHEHPVLLEETFDPSRHLRFAPPSKIHSMEELGFDRDIGVSPVAVSEPFPLFSQEAVARFREEVLSDEVRNNFKVSSNLAHCQLRGFADKCAPFIYETWNNPEVLRIISGIAGIELVPAMDLDISHINLSLQDQDTVAEERHAVQDSEDDDKNALVGWHKDSYPFVCVVMLSDCSQMMGGETALRTGTGEILKVRGPHMGCAVVLQGRYIEHQALRTLGGAERITMVTSFRPKDPFARDDTVLTTIRPITNLVELYAQYGEYRLGILEERIRAEVKKIREARDAGRAISTRKFKSFLEEQQRFIEQTNREIVEEDQVTVGEMPSTHVQ